MAEKPLIIVESPTKARTIEKFLGRRYSVAASMGHVRDLPKSQIGVDVDKGFEPKYITIRGKGDILKDLRKQSSKAKKVYLATDPDREGEAISWHLAQALGLHDVDDCRVEFHEITKDAVSRALKHPRPIDQHLVDSQQARRVLDRLVGYNLSPLLWKKVRPGLSAGRVQSAALRLIADREEEIEAFQPKEYWSLTASLRQAPGKESFTARFYGEKDEKTELPTRQAVDEVKEGLHAKAFLVDSVKKRERRRAPAPAFITSTLQQEASRRHGFSGKKTMALAQQLYEGIDAGAEGTVGLITYIRTDSTRVSDEARDQARVFISEKYGADYLEQGAAKAEEKRPGQQGAHEAIRPTAVSRTPELMKQHLAPDQYKLYRLVYERFVASNMAPAVYDTVTAEIKAGSYKFRASGSTLKFSGFLAFSNDQSEEENREYSEPTLPELRSGEELILVSLDEKQHFTQAPPRYTEAMLVKTLEEKGIGRPSTYAPIVETLLSRGYIVKSERKLEPTSLGKTVTTILKDYFPEVVNVEFTANMEKKLDDIEEGEAAWQSVLEDFYGGFAQTLSSAEERIGGFEVEDEVTDIPCDKCGRLMVKKYGRYGPFLACPGFPECRNAKPLLQEIDVPCPVCGGKIVVRKTKKGRTFYGCSNYPNCSFTSWNKPVEKNCPDCGAIMLEKKSRGKVTYVCSKECGYTEEAASEEESQE